MFPPLFKQRPNTLPNMMPKHRTLSYPDSKVAGVSQLTRSLQPRLRLLLDFDGCARGLELGLDIVGFFFANVFLDNAARLD